MKTWRHWLLYAVCLPWDLTIAWPAILLIRLFWGRELHWETPPYFRSIGGGPVLVCALRWGTWPVSKSKWLGGWYLRQSADGELRAWGGTTLGHGIFYGPDMDFKKPWQRLQAHEHIHVEQMEAAFVASFLMTCFTGFCGFFWYLFGWSWYGFFCVTLPVLWWYGGLAVMSGGWVAAWARGEPYYRGSQHEESAYAQDDHLVGS